LRHNRVSHLRAETLQDNLEVLHRHRGRPTASPRRLDVVLIVCAGDGAVPTTPLAAVRGMPCPLAGRGSAGPLARSQPRVGLKQGLAERAALPTASPRGSGHRSPLRWKATPYPMRMAPVQDRCGEVGWTEPTRASRDGETPGEIPDEGSLTVTTAVMAKGDEVDGGATTSRPLPPKIQRISLDALGPLVLASAAT
jgi:hypothetical protein